MAKKSKKKLDQSFRKKPEGITDQSGQTPQNVIFKPDYLDTQTRIGFILIGYILFLAGSIGCSILGVAGAEKKGSSEVKIIGLTLLVCHILFVALLFIDAAKTGILPIKIIFIILAVYPVLLIILGFAGLKTFWGNTVRTVGLIIIIPQLIAITIINPSVVWDQVRGNEILTQANLRIIKASLQKYEQKHDGTFPSDISSLVSEQVARKTPTNPFNGLEMKSIMFGDSDYQGNFSYLPVTAENKIVGYYLLAYGSERNPGKDVNGDSVPDHVISVIQGLGGTEKMTPDQYQKTVRDFPPLQTLL
jgi:hypothetical protein